jgi:hypothetical protein
MANMQGQLLAIVELTIYNNTGQRNPKKTTCLMFCTFKHLRNFYTYRAISHKPELNICQYVILTPYMVCWFYTGQYSCNILLCPTSITASFNMI